MAESSGEKTEKPTGKRKADARKEGNVPQSREVTAAISLAASFYGLKFLYRFMSSQMTGSIKEYFGMIGYQETFSDTDSHTVFLDGVLRFFTAALPLLAVTGLAAVAAVFAQTRLMVNFRLIRPKLSRLDPVSGFKRLFSLNGIAEVFKSVVKISVILLIIYFSIKQKIPELPKLIDSDIYIASEFTGSVIFDIINRTAAAFAVLAAGDYIYQRYRYNKQLRMTRQELKEEFRQTEGDPQIKGKIREKQKEISLSSMIKGAETADVIICDGTRCAAALKYDFGKNKAPVLAAGGFDAMAVRIIETGKKHNVAVSENAVLARELCAASDIGGEIPAELYRAAAEELARVFSLEKKELN